MAYVYKTQKSLRKKVINYMTVGGIISVFIGMYIGLMTNAIIAGHFGSEAFSIRYHWEAVRERGFPWLMVILCIAFLVFVLGYCIYTWYLRSTNVDPLGRGFIFSLDKQPYGSAHFASPEEYVRNALVDPIETAIGPILGMQDEEGEEIINLRVDSKNRFNPHILVFGPSGSGKTFGFSAPYIYQTIRRRESIVLTDPDGGLYEDYAGLFQKYGYVVRRLDLKTIRKSDGWDCLSSVRGDEIILNAQIFAHTVISSIEEKGSVYSRAAESLLLAVILRVVLGTDVPESQKTIATVYNILSNPAGETYLEGTVFNETLLSLYKAEAAMKSYTAFKHSSKNLSGNILTHLTTGLNTFDNGDILRMLSTPDIDLELPGQIPCAYFCIFPDSHDKQEFLVDLFFSMFFQRLTLFADLSKGRKLPVPVNFLLDEFAQIHIPQFDRKISTIRKRKMSVAIIIQNYGQLVSVYDKAAKTIYNNCSTVLFLGTNDLETAQMISKRCGQTTVVVETEQRKDRTLSLFKVVRPYSKGVGKADLVSEADAMELDVDTSIVLFQTQQPVVCHSYPHTLHPMSRELISIPASSLPDIDDVDERMRLRRAEAERIRHFNELHPDLCGDKFDRSFKAQTEEADAITIANLTWWDMMVEKIRDLLNLNNPFDDYDGKDAPEDDFVDEEPEEYIAGEIEEEVELEIDDTEVFSGGVFDGAYEMKQVKKKPEDDLTDKNGRKKPDAYIPRDGEDEVGEEGEDNSDNGEADEQKEKPKQSKKKKSGDGLPDYDFAGADTIRGQANLPGKRPKS